ARIRSAPVEVRYHQVGEAPRKDLYAPEGVIESWRAGGRRGRDGLGFPGGHGDAVAEGTGSSGRRLSHRNQNRGPQRAQRSSGPLDPSKGASSKHPASTHREGETERYAEAIIA